MSLQWNIQVHECIGSTQDVLKHSAPLEGTVVHALSQNAGRGRHGRVWEEAKGNLYLSFALEPQQDAALMGQVSLLMGLAVYKTVAAYIGAHYKKLILKWPNDVLVDGRKCAGILIEADITPNGHINMLYVGIGVNLAAAPLDTSCALDDFTDAPINMEAFRGDLLENVKTLYQRWLDGQADAILLEWQDAGHPIGGDVTVKVGAQVQSGQFHGLDQFGSLILSLGENQFKTITGAEVFLPSKD